MKKLHVGRRLALLVAAGAIVLAAAGIARSAGGELPVTVEAAKAAVQAMAPEASELKVSGPTDTAIGRHYTVSGTNVRASVDSRDGRVTSLLVLDRRPRAGETKLTSDAAIEAATRFLMAHSIPFDGLRSSVRLVNHGASNEYEVTWQRYEKDVEVPDSRSVRVDAATGSVFWFSDVRRPFAPPPAPLVDYDRATEVAAAASGFEQPTIVAGTLKVVINAIDAQRLVWSIEVASRLTSDVPSGDYFEYAWVEVDALTGGATVVGRG